MTTEERLAAIESRIEKLEKLIGKASDAFSRAAASPMAKQLLSTLGIKLDLTSSDPGRR